jgi:hypothetical protein
MKRATFVAICLLFISAIAAADDDFPIAEIYGGYQVLRTGGRNLSGFNSSIEWNAAENWGMVGEFGFGMTSVSAASVKNAAILGGVRGNYRSDQFRLFIHILGGVNHVSGGTSVGVVRAGASRTGFGMVLGTGLDFNVGKKIAIRPVQVDWLAGIYDIMGGKGDGDSMFRYSAGIVFKLGSKYR